jgi:hypothetical protein
MEVLGKLKFPKNSHNLFLTRLKKRNNADQKRTTLVEPSSSTPGAVPEAD